MEDKGGGRGREREGLVCGEQRVATSRWRWTIEKRKTGSEQWNSLSALVPRSATFCSLLTRYTDVNHHHKFHCDFKVAHHRSDSVRLRCFQCCSVQSASALRSFVCACILTACGCRSIPHPQLRVFVFLCHLPSLSLSTLMFLCSPGRNCRHVFTTVHLSST